MLEQSTRLVRTLIKSLCLMTTPSRRVTDTESPELQPGPGLLSARFVVISCLGCVRYSGRLSDPALSHRTWPTDWWSILRFHAEQIICRKIFTPMLVRSTKVEYWCMGVSEHQSGEAPRKDSSGAFWRTRFLRIGDKAFPRRRSCG